MKTGYIALAIVMAGSLALSLLHCPLFDIFFDDKEIFKYTGMAMAKGKIPYRDFFDHKPPLIFFINFLGYSIESWGLWLIDSLLVLAASIFFVETCKKEKLVYPWLLPLLFNLLLRNNVASLGIGLTREYTSVFLLVFFCLLLTRSQYKYLLSGIICGLVFFTQQDQVLLCIPFYLFSLSKSKDSFQSIFRKLLQTAVGFLVVSTLILSYFVYHSSLQYFWQDAFLFNFQWYSDKRPLAETLAAIIKYLHGTVFEPLFILSFLAVVALCFIKTDKRQLLIAAAITGLLSFISHFLSSRTVNGGMMYYLQTLSFTICIMLFAVSQTINKLLTKNIKLALGFAVIVGAYPLAAMANYARHLPNTRIDKANREQVFSYLYEQNLNDYELYVAFDANYVCLYNDNKILSPSKWIYHFFWSWFPKWDADNSIINSIIIELTEHKTKYILDYSKDFSFSNPAVPARWNNFLLEKYEQVALKTPLNGGVIWRIKQ